MNFETLETERLILRKLTPEILSELFKNYPKEEVKKILGLRTDEEFNTEKEKAEGGYVTYDRTILAFLLVNKQSQETIGRCGFHNWYKAHRRAEIGYVLYAEELKQQGYMTEALQAILRYGFTTMNLNRIEACIGPTNIASQSLAKKYGFIQEGYLRQHYIRNNQIEDSLIFSLLKEEYTAGE